LAHRRVPRYVRAVGEELVSFDPGAESRQVQRLQLAEGVDTNRALGVADRDVLEDPLAPIGAQHSAPVAGTVRVVARAQARAAHVDGTRVEARDRRAELARNGMDREAVPVGPAPATQVEDRLARAIAGQ